MPMEFLPLPFFVISFSLFFFWLKDLCVSGKSFGSLAERKYRVTTHSMNVKLALVGSNRSTSWTVLININLFI